jgi:hypothetical protein
MIKQNWCDRCDEIVKEDDLWQTNDVWGVFDSRSMKDMFDDGCVRVCHKCLANKELIEEVNED